ncbi:hypothetical protein [Streptomyces sp. NPDC059009]|uniref:hypothetical protein n=1 Tax=Streptomyces sp. NPDC059009 TaxID=3346694 RepID=UPI0036B6ED35
MSARDELIEIVMRDQISCAGDEVWATDLVDALEADVRRACAATVRTTKLRRIMNDDDKRINRALERAAWLIEEGQK